MEFTTDFQIVKGFRKLYNNYSKYPACMKLKTSQCFISKFNSILKFSVYLKYIYDIVLSIFTEL